MNLLNKCTIQIYPIRGAEKKHPASDYQQGVKLYSAG
jgi:hypothetical protein